MHRRGVLFPADPAANVIYQQKLISFLSPLSGSSPENPDKIFGRPPVYLEFMWKFRKKVIDLGGFFGYNMLA